MSYVFNYNDAVAYEKSSKNYYCELSTSLENQLIINMLDPIKNHSILDIGCGVGLNFTNFLNNNLNVTGVDPSSYMLEIASKSAKNRVDLHRGFAENLPFEDNTFNYACISTTLEFVDDPEKALEEACRVAKDKVFIGIFNKYGLNRESIKKKVTKFKVADNFAKLFRINDIKKYLRSLLGADIVIDWRTIHLLFASKKLILKATKPKILQHIPFGYYAGIVTSPIPRYRTRPLSILQNQKEQSAGALNYFKTKNIKKILKEEE